MTWDDSKISHTFTAMKLEYLGYNDPDFSIIHKILPRFSLISRQAVSQFGEIQVIAANTKAGM